MPRPTHVVVVGPESTGKTTLARELAQHFAAAWVPEYLREYLDAKGSVCEPGDLPLVVAGQRARTQAAMAGNPRLVVSDTDALMTLVYSRWYYGVVPPWLDAAVDDSAPDLYLLLDVDVPWVADQHRDEPTRRADLLDACVGALDARRRPFVWVRGAWDTRRDTAIRAIEDLLARRNN